jgi:hypothetical protein
MFRNHTADKHCPKIVMAVALLVSAIANAATPASRPDVVISVFADHYLMANRIIDDVNILEESVKSLDPRAVTLIACGSAADRAQRAAAHRFRNSLLELRLVDVYAPACRSTVRAQTSNGNHSVRPFNIDDKAVDEWWHASMP